MKRKSKQKRAYLGHRSHGRGNVKNRRGSGNRGGRGMAGIDKHKWSWATKNVPKYFGKYGFVRPVKKDVPVTHLYELNQRALLNKLEMKNNKYFFEFNGKILGTGSISVPLSVRALSWSKSAEKKIISSGGDITKLVQEDQNKK